MKIRMISIPYIFCLQAMSRMNLYIIYIKNVNLNQLDILKQLLYPIYKNFIIVD